MTDKNLPFQSNALAHQQESNQNLALSPERGYPGASSDEINLLDYWRLLLRNKWRIILVTLVAVIFALLLTFLSKPVYEADAVLQIEKNANQIINFQGVDRIESDSYLNIQSFYSTQFELLHSDSLAWRVISQLNLASNRHFAGEPNKKPGLISATITWIKDQIKDLTGGTEQREKASDQNQAQREQNRLISKFLSAFTVSPVGDSRLVKVAFSSTDPELAAQVANAIAMTYMRMNLERKQESVKFARKFLDERLMQVRQRLEDSERKLGKFADDKQIINIDERQQLIAHKLQQLETALSDAQTKRIEAESEYRQVRNIASSGGLPQVLESPVIQQYKQSLTELESEYQDGLRVFKPAYPKMRQMASRIQQVKQRIDDEISQIQQSLKARFDAASTNENMLRRQLVAARREAIDDQNRSVQFNIMQREVDTNSELYQGLLQRYKEISVAEGVTSNNVSVVDPAEIPFRPIKPRPALNLAIAIILGLGLGIVWVFLREVLNDRVRDVKDFESRFGVPVLGVVPAVDSKPSDRGLAFHLVDKPRSFFSEAYRSVRVALQFVTTHGTPHILAVTSAEKGEGKTSTSTSLAVALTQAGKRVLLIDGDLRLPTIATVFSLEGRDGLVHYLTGKASSQQVIYQTEVSNLYCIPAGIRPPNPSELLDSQLMVDLLEEVRGEYDSIIIDCPPVLGLADALIIGRQAEATLLVTDTTKTSRGVVEQSLDRMRSVRLSIAGAVLTKVPATDSHFRYYLQYKYGPEDDSGLKGLPHT